MTFTNRQEFLGKLPQCVLRFFDVLDGTLTTFNNIDHILGAAIGGDFNSEDFVGHCAAESYALSHVGTCFAAWLLTPAIPVQVSLTWPKAAHTRRSFKLVGR